MKELNSYSQEKKEEHNCYEIIIKTSFKGECSVMF